jgi:hypothetical protein
MDEHHHVRVLLDGAGVAQVREARLAAALLDCARELREREHRDFKLAREPFSEREISVTCCTRESMRACSVGTMSWR